MNSYTQATANDATHLRFSDGTVVALEFSSYPEMVKEAICNVLQAHGNDLLKIDGDPTGTAKAQHRAKADAYGAFADMNHAFGVLLEEMDELADAVEYADSTREPLSRVSAIIGDHLLRCIRESESGHVVKIAEMMSKAAVLRAEALRAEYAECLDVAAVCDRVVDQWGINDKAQ